jgi:RNA polymerase sigma-70 factor (ECF subfamily)
VVNDISRDGLLSPAAAPKDDLATTDFAAADFTEAGFGTADPAPTDWVLALSSPGPGQQTALRALHDLMVRAAAHQVWRMRGILPDSSPGTVDVIVNQAADEAMAALLRKLHTFEGRSAFTTWAFKFAILQAGSDVRRMQWQHREVELRDLDVEHVSSLVHEGPERQVEGSDLARALAHSMRSCLTPHQRRVAVALLVDGVPIDVLAERLGTNRNALYKTVHDVRQRLRHDLTARGYLPDAVAHSGTGSHPTRPAGTS